MADSAAQIVNCNTSNLHRDVVILHIYNLNLSHDGIRLIWNNTFEELQGFFRDTVGLSGKWTSPSGKSKRYFEKGFDLIVNWYRGKQNSLLFQGKDGSLLREYLISFFTQAAVLSCPVKSQSPPDNINIENHSLSTSCVEVICDDTNNVDTSKAKEDVISVADVSSMKNLSILLITLFKICLSCHVI